jgi:hypothetical protein
MELKLQLQEQNNSSKKKKGKGRGKKSSERDDCDFSEEVAKEAQRRLRSFLQSEASTSESFESLPIPSAPPLEDWTDNTSIRSRPQSLNSQPQSRFPAQTATEKVYITSIEVTLNGTPLDQVTDKQNEEECMQAYWRLFTFNGQMNSLFTNGIRKIALFTS